MIPKNHIGENNMYVAKGSVTGKIYTMQETQGLISQWLINNFPTVGDSGDYYEDTLPEEIRVIKVKVNK